MFDPSTVKSLIFAHQELLLLCKGFTSHQQLRSYGEGTSIKCLILMRSSLIMSLVLISPSAWFNSIFNYNTFCTNFGKNYVFRLSERFHKLHIHNYWNDLKNLIRYLINTSMGVF